MLKEVQGRPLSDVKELKVIDISDLDEQDRLRATGWVQVVTADGREIRAGEQLLFVRFG